MRGIEKGEPRNEPDPVTLRKLSLGLGWTPESADRLLAGEQPRDVIAAEARARDALSAAHVEVETARAASDGTPRSEGVLAVALAAAAAAETEWQLLRQLADEWIERRRQVREGTDRRLERRIAQLERQVASIEDRLDSYDPGES